MAYIQKRTGKNGKKSYRVQIRRKGQPIQSATFSTKAQALEWSAHIESQIAQGKHFKTSPAKEKTVGSAIDRYIKTALPDKSPSTQRDQKHQLLWWKDQIGDIKLSALSPALIIEHRDGLKSQNFDKHSVSGKVYSNATVNRYMSAFSSVLNKCVNEWQWLDTHPIHGRIKKLPENNKRDRWLSDAEREKLLSACKNASNPIIYDVVIVALNTGMRRSEIMNLTWKAIDFDNKWLYVEKTKNKEKRGIPMSPPVLKVLGNRKKQNSQNSKYVFPSSDGSQPFAIKSLWDKTLLDAEIDDFKFHDLRHTAASYFMMSGASLLDVQKILGHKSLEMVQRYAHLSKDHLSEMADKMSDKYFD
tara:strand:+ start:836 stop:1912 length:1077 start_codon:yes stop_codon:yes gene_type:complete